MRVFEVFFRVFKGFVLFCSGYTGVLRSFKVFLRVSEVFFYGFLRVVEGFNGFKVF